MKILIFLYLLILVLAAMCNDQVLILKYNRRGDCAESVIGLPMKSAMKEFTFCGKYSLKFFKSYVLMGFDMNTFVLMQYEKRRIQLKIYGDIAWVNLENYSLEPDQWQHFCLSVSSKQVQIVMNGFILQNETMDYTSEQITSDEMWIGGIVGDKVYEDRRMEGAITEVHVWNETLESKYLVSITSLNVGPTVTLPPASFSWQTLKMQSNTSCIEYIMLDGIDESFHENSQKNVLIEHLADFNSSNYLCQAFGGKLLVPKTDHDLNEVSSLINQSDKCSHALLGLKKINKTTVVDSDDQIASFVKWRKTQPNGKDIEQCVVVWKTEFDDTGCHNKYCFSCQIRAKIIFTLRGNLSDAIEREFFVDMTKKKQRLEDF